MPRGNLLLAGTRRPRTAAGRTGGPARDRDPRRAHGRRSPSRPHGSGFFPDRGRQNRDTGREVLSPRPWTSRVTTSSSSAPATPACARRTRRASAARRVLVLEKADRGVVGRQLRVHRRRDPHRPRRPRRRARARSRASTSGCRDTDLDPYTAEDFLADMRRVTLGRGDAAMARILVGDSARRRALAARARRCASGSCTSARPTRSTGATASGAASRSAPSTAARGSWTQHRAAARARRDRAAPRAPRSRTSLRDDGRARRAASWSATRTARDGAARRGAVVLAAGGFESNPQLRAAHLGPNWDVAKVRGTPHNTGEVLMAALAPRRAGLRALERLPRDPVGRRRAADRRPRDHEPLLAPVLSGRDRREPARRALPRRGRGLPQLHLREVRRRGPRAARGHRRAGLRRQDGRRSCARSTTRRRARRASTPTRSASSPTGSASTATGFERTVAAFNAAIAAGRRSTRRSRTASAPRASRRRSPTGRCRSTRRRSPAFPITCGITFTFGGVRVDDDARVLDAARPPASPACTRPASSSAACSSTTTPAAAG